MLNNKYPSLEQANSGLCFGLNSAGLEQLQARGLHNHHTIKSLADKVFSSIRMRNDAYFIRFNDTQDGFGFSYESHITSIEDGWNNFASKWAADAESYFNKDYDKKYGIIRSGNGEIPRTVENLKGFLAFSSNRSLYDKPLLKAVIDGTLTFDLYKSRIEHLQKLATNHIKRHAQRFNLDQITDTTDIEKPVFLTVF